MLSHWRFLALALQFASRASLSLGKSVNVDARTASSSPGHGNDTVAFLEDDVDVQEACFRSRWDWLWSSSSYSASASRALESTSYGPVETETYFDEEEYDPNDSGPWTNTNVLPCDGMERYTMYDDVDTSTEHAMVHTSISYSHRSSPWILKVRRTTEVFTMSSTFIRPFSDIQKEPICTIEESHCRRFRRSASSSYFRTARNRYEARFSAEADKVCNVAGCPAKTRECPEESCPTARECPEEACPAACFLSADQFMVLYWPDKVQNRDICADDLFGTNDVVTPTVTRNTPWVVSTTEIVMKYMNTGWEPGDITRYTTVKGQWNFTSPTVYVAFHTLKAERCGKPVGTPFSSDVIAVQPHQVSSIVARYPEYHNGSRKALVKAFVDHGPFDFGEPEYETRSYNYANMRGQMPAAVWLLGNHDFCWQQQYECTAIAQDMYNPDIYLPPEVLTTLHPAWSDCINPMGFKDPVLALPTAPTLAVPTLSNLGLKVGAMPIVAPQRLGLAQPTPSQTATASPAAQTLALNDISQAEVLPLGKIRPDIGLQSSNSGGNSELDHAYVAADGILSEDNTPRFMQAVQSTPTSPRLGLGASIALSSHELQPGASATTVDGMIVSLASDSQNVVLDGQRVAVSALSGEESRASTGWEESVHFDKSGIAITASCGQNDKAFQKEGNLQSNDGVFDASSHFKSAQTAYESTMPATGAVTDVKAKAMKGESESDAISNRMLVFVVFVGLSWLFG